jgi:hypothetical protein
MTQNQYPETLLRFGPKIECVKEDLRAGRQPSEIANALNAQGLSNIELMIIFREATGASIRDLKAFGQWWSGLGVTDSPAFDSWAAEVFRQAGTIA